MSEPRSAARALPYRAITLGLVLATLVLAGALWLLRSALATAILRSSLESRGVHCAPLEVEASGLLGELAIAPSSCEVDEGPVSRFSWDAPLALTLEGGSVASLEARGIALERRPGGDEPRLLGAIGVWLEAPARVSGLVHFAARLSELDSPALRVDRLSVTREGATEPELVLVALRCAERARDTPVVITIDELSLATSTGPLGLSAAPRLGEVRVQADRTHGSLEGTIDASLEVPGLGALQLGSITGEQRLRIEATDLDTTPRWSVEL